MKIAKLKNKAFGMPFQIDEKTLDDFIKWNTPQWQSTGKASNGYCIVNFIMINKEMSMMLPKLMYAKAVEEAQGFVPIIIDWGSNPSLTRFYSSFGVRFISLHKAMVCNIGGIIQSLKIVHSFKKGNKSGLELQRLEVDGVQIGRSIYGDILRSSYLSTIRTVEDKVCFQKLFTLTLFADTFYKLMKKYPPKVCISDDWAYNEGIALEYANQAGAFIIQSNILREDILTTGKGQFIRYRHEEIHNQMKHYIDSGQPFDETVVDEYLAKRFSGQNTSFRDKEAYIGKKDISREEWNCSMGLDPHKKNVVIMCHTFSDAVFTSEYSAFRDYYDWTEQTLRLIAGLDNVNWIVKPHPARSQYNESRDSFESMFAKYETANMHLFPDEVSTASLKNVADVLVTVCGTSGMEFSCFGIPIVACGKAMYTDFGYTTVPHTLEEYKTVLQNIHQMQTLNESQIVMARKVLCAYIKCFDTPRDEWDELLCSRLRAMQNTEVKPQDADRNVCEYNTALVEDLHGFVQVHPWKESVFYKQGYSLAKRCQLDIVRYN